MGTPLDHALESYDPTTPLERAGTLPSACYTDPGGMDRERRQVFARSWQFIGRLDALTSPGDFLTTEVAGEPIVAVRGDDGKLRAFHNVCRHHAAAVATDEAGSCNLFRCPYHGWTYSLRGELRGTPEFEGVAGFDRAENGLVPIRLEVWETFLFVDLSGLLPPLQEVLGEMVERVEALDLSSLRFQERRVYSLECNWKVYIDNYLDGGYHVPHLHRSLSSVLDHQGYRIENGEHHSLQTSPMQPGKDSATTAVRAGTEAFYLWVYPNFMINAYEGVMDINLVRPLGLDRCEVVFDYYFSAVDESSRDRNTASISVAERVQDEDLAICESVQRGLGSRAYDIGRFSVRREAGEHLFHRLLHRDLTAP